MFSDPDSEVEVLIGRFTKQGGGNGGWKTWKERIFVLERSGVFRYYKDQQMEELCGGGNLASCTEVQIDEDNLDIVKFKVPKEQRESQWWVFKFHNDDDRNAWIEMAEKREMKILLLGMGGIGKTCITNVFRFGEDGYHELYDPTIQDDHRVYLEVDNKESCLNIVDLAGQDGYLMLQDQHIRDANGIVLCYAMNERISWELLEENVKTILNIREELNEDITKFPLVMVATKCDLGEEKREVSIEEGLQYAQERLNCPHIESSAKMNTNIQQIFEEAVRVIREPFQMHRMTISHSGDNHNHFYK